MMKKAKNRKITKITKARENIKKSIAEIARIDIDKINESDKIRDDLGVDSLMAMEILAAIEKKIGIVIDEVKAFNIVTVKDLLDLVTQCLKEKKRL